jgi:mRNA-degrading endonuclease RelE of RelBE toxin-antitoxin system
MARVEITPDAQQQIEDLPGGIVQRVLAVIERLPNWPAVSGAKPLKGNRFGQYRLRTGDFRVIVRPVGDVIYVLEVGNRKDIYEE